MMHGQKNVKLIQSVWKKMCDLKIPVHNSAIHYLHLRGTYEK